MILILSPFQYNGYMVSFECDYNNGMAPNILRRLIEENDTPQSGYGNDEYTFSAVRKIKAALCRDDVMVTLVAGGTQTNQLVISTLLARSEGVIAAGSGHINVHEAGAIEYTGHKVIALEATAGKIVPERLSAYMEEYMDSEPKEALVTPKMVYISQPTEIGTIYSKKELVAIRNICNAYGLYLFIDGARLAYALASPENNVTLTDIATLSDVFYIGGTKCGAIIGEAVVIKDKICPVNLAQMKKQEGALLAKGRLLGLQFDTLFTDNYYLSLGEVGIKRAQRLREIMKEKGYEEAWPSPTNQLFFIMDDAKIKTLKEKIIFERWGKYDSGRSVVRFCTSWSTTERDLDEVVKIL